MWSVCSLCKQRLMPKRATSLRVKIFQWPSRMIAASLQPVQFSPGLLTMLFHAVQRSLEHLPTPTPTPTITTSARIIATEVATAADNIFYSLRPCHQQMTLARRFPPLIAQHGPFRGGNFALQQRRRRRRNAAVLNAASTQTSLLSQMPRR